MNYITPAPLKKGYTIGLITPSSPLMSGRLEAGVFNQVAGVIFCHFEDCVAKYFPERDGNIKDVISEWSSRLNVPCIKDFPCGHGINRCVLPIGRNIILDASNTTINIPSIKNNICTK